MGILMVMAGRLSTTTLCCLLQDAEALTAALGQSALQHTWHFECLLVQVVLPGGRPLLLLGITSAVLLSMITEEAAPCPEAYLPLV